MIIECTNCHAKYQYDDERFERKPSKKIKCAKCQHIFEIINPAFAVQPAAKPAGESTGIKRDMAPRNEPLRESTTSEASVPQHSTDKLTGTLQMPPGKRLSLAIIDGPDAGSVFRIEKPRVVIGRSNADLTLNDTEASRNHAAVEVRDTVFILLDLGSTNGTMYEGQRINDPVELQNHSEFVVGTSTLMLIVTEDT